MEEAEKSVEHKDVKTTNQNSEKKKESKKMWRV